MLNLKWKTEKVPLSKLKGYEKNPRKISDASLAILKDSIERFGQVKPIVCNIDYTVIGGNQRLKVLPDGDVYVNIPERELTDDEVKEIVVMLNNKVGDWDIEKLEIMGFDDDILVTQFGLDEELVAGMGFNFDDLNFSDIGGGKIIKKLIVNFKDYDYKDVEEMFTNLKSAHELDTKEEVLLKLFNLYETDNS